MNIRVAPSFSNFRESNLYKELSFALLRTDSEKIKKWGSQSAKRFIKLAGRRINALSSLVVSVSKVDFTRYARHIIMSKMERRKLNEGYQVYG